MELHNHRKNYTKGMIAGDSIPDNPLKWFSEWIGEAIASGSHEANAMVLSTVSAGGQPSSRVVLLKKFDEEGFLFFTNYESNKASQLTANPASALLFYWPELERQVRIEGITKKSDQAVSDKYFSDRPLESRISAVVSPQSREVPDREFLEKKHRDLLSESSGGDLLRPDYWGGYLLKPELFEFWQGRSNRLHDRIRFELSGDGWKIVRLAP